MEELILKAYKKANLYYFAVFIMAGIAALSSYFFMTEFPNLFDFQKNVVTIVSSIMMLYLITSIPFALWVFNKKVPLLKQIEDLQSRYKSYMNWVKLRMLLIGVNFVFDIGLYFIMKSDSFFFAAAIGSVAMFFCKPNIRNVENELDSTTEIKE